MSDDVRPTPALDEYDRLQSQYEGLPGVLRIDSRPLRVVPFLGVHGTTTWLVQTVRVPDAGGDLVFLDCNRGAGSFRLVLPPDVTAAIARQRDALASKSRRRAARAAARTRPAGSSAHLLDPAVRAKAQATRRAKAAKRRARKAGAR